MNSPACTQFVKSLKSLVYLVVTQWWENEPRKLVELKRSDLVPGDISSLFSSRPLQPVTWCQVSGDISSLSHSRPLQPVTWCQVTPSQDSPSGPCHVWFPRIPGLYSTPKFHDATLDSLVCSKFIFIEEDLGGEQGGKKSF